MFQGGVVIPTVISKVPPMSSTVPGAEQGHNTDFLNKETDSGGTQDVKKQRAHQEGKHQLPSEGCREAQEKIHTRSQLPEEG